MNFIKKKISRLDDKTKNLGKNSFYMLFIQIFTICLNLLLVPLTIDYVNPDTYGIWLTLSSVVAWISVLNIGLNNSLRNRLTEVRTLGNDLMARKYVSTTYAILSCIFCSFLFLFVCINPMINWANIFNLSQELENELKIVMAIIVAYFCLRFILSTINVILLAEHKSAESSFRTLIEQSISIIIIYVLTKTTEGSLLYLCIGLCVTPIIVLLIFNIGLFNNRFKAIAPSVKYIDFSLTKDLLSVGLKFFIISLAGIIQFQLANFIILRYFGGEQVAGYNIAFKYFNVAYMVFSLLLTPLWSTVTKAKVQNDYIWINNTVKNYLIIALLFCVGVFIMLLLSPKIYPLWLQDNYFEIPIALSGVMALYKMTFIIGGVFVTVLNGLGELNIQTKVCLISPLVYLLLCFYFLKFTELGIVGVVLASILSNFNAWIVAPIQVKKMIKNQCE